MKKNIAMVKQNNDFTCSYCKKIFKRERTVESHACEPRRRWKNKNSKNVIIGFDTFKRFYKSCSGPGSKDKSFNDFIKSSYYTAFVLFGNYCVNSNVFAPNRYADYLIKNDIKLNKWATDTIYKEFLIYFISKEPVNDALTRTIEYAIKWGEERDYPYNELFEHSVNTVCHEINTGRISPWVLYMSNSGIRFLENLEDWQHEGIWNMINADVWQKRFDDADDVKFAKNILILGGW